jgi:hypothetical protein
MTIPHFLDNRLGDCLENVGWSSYLHSGGAQFEPVHHRLHITPPLRAQPVGAICRFVKHDVSETGFFLRFQVDPTQLGAIDRGIVCLGIQSPKLYVLNKVLDDG